jgi:hypothetical protein
MKEEINTAGKPTTDGKRPEVGRTAIYEKTMTKRQRTTKGNTTTTKG